MSETNSILDMTVVESLRQLGGPGDDLFLELVELFLEDAAGLVANLRSALQEGDIQTLERTAHTLKSSSANVGARHFAELCFEVERLGREGVFDGVEPRVAGIESEFQRVREALIAAGS